MIWGAQISEDLEKTLKVMLIITGVKSAQIVGAGHTSSDKKKQEISEELGIDFVE
jgi:cell division protein FtsZ